MTDQQTKISVIIVNCNGLSYILDCLKSVYNSNYSNYEVIVSDNGSIDGSVEQIKKNFPLVKIVLNGRNIGFSEGNNAALRQATGKLFFLLNDDTVIHPDLLSVLAKEIESDPNIGIVGPKIYFMNEKDRIWFAGGFIDWPKSTGGNIGRGLQDYELVNDVKREVDFITGCALMIKKEVVDKIGLLDKKFFIYYEDADWCQRAKKAGYKVRYLPFGGVWHAKSVTSVRHVVNKQQSKMRIIGEYLKNSNRMKYTKYRNRFVFFMRHQPAKYKFKFLLKFILITTPAFIWDILIKTPTSLIRTISQKWKINF